MGFTVVKKTRCASNQNKVVIRKNGTISINRLTTEKYGLDNVTHALCLYDYDKDKIGLKFGLNTLEGEETNNLCKLSRSKTNVTTFSARSFLREVKYDHDETHSLDFDFDESSMMFVIRVNPCNFFKELEDDKVEDGDIEEE